MDQANLTLIFKFNDKTPDATLNIYDEDFDFQYGVRDRKGEGLESDLLAGISIESEEGIYLAQKFLFANCVPIAKENNLKEIAITIFRPSHPENNKTFVFPQDTFKNFSFTYINNNLRNHNFNIYFTILPKIEE